MGLNAIDRLESLALPPLSGKSFLEIGCCGGEACGYAFFDGAAPIMGLDDNEDAIGKARQSFPECRFEVIESGRLEKTGADKYDVIVCSLKIPYLNEPKTVLSEAMAKLNREGTLALEVDITDDEALLKRISGLKRVDRRHFPLSWLELHEMLSPYAFKYMSEESAGSNDSIRRLVFHVKNRKPYAILLMGPSGSGKTTAAKHILPNFPVIHGDELMLELVKMPEGALRDRFPYLNELCGREELATRIGGVMIEIFNSAAGKEYARYVAERCGSRDFVYEGCIHENFQKVFSRQLECLGYKVLKVETNDPDFSPNGLFKRASQEARKFGIFLAERKKAANLPI